ncbi:MAG TPA: M48 family metallopeptidase [Verrucomicrobiae bacterium]|jgi:STE24 endopeptidase|nr:M48 family metallopeptidase [Verrucomicrobiae bacterium]
MDESRGNAESLKGQARDAKSYQRIKENLTLIHLVWSPLLLALVAFTPVTRWLAGAASGFTANRYGEAALYYLFLSLVFFLANLPLAYYSEFTIEHRYGLSNQTFGGWVGFTIKKTVLTTLLSVALVTGLYVFIWKFPAAWWVLGWAAYVVLSVVIGKVFPVLIVPLFYKYDRVQDQALRGRILALTDRYGLPIENLYSLNLSKTTKKANAAFMGMGKGKRVVLSDTLIEHFSPEEIEIVVAHELGHYKHRDILKQVALGSVSSLAIFYLAFHTLEASSRALGFDGAGDLLALPLLFLIFTIAGTLLTPVQSVFSRSLERAADRFALEAVKSVDTFISCMEKLGRVNLADTSPHPVYEWFFYDHPSIPRRIEMARKWSAAS